MDKTMVEALAKAAGLGKALADHPADVHAAATQALDTAGAILYPTDPTVEPWPPMRAGSGLAGMATRGTGRTETAPTQQQRGMNAGGTGR